jgi:hypothetical protein
VSSSPAEAFSRTERTAPQAFSVDVDPAVTIERVCVVFDNDFWSRGLGDRNLHVHSVEFGGRVFTPGDGHATYHDAIWTSWERARMVEGTGALKWNGALSFGETRTITVHAAGQSWRGDPAFDLLVNGTTLRSGVKVASPGGSADIDDLLERMEAFHFKVDAALDIRTIGVAFRNDLHDGSPDRDRNLLVGGVEIDGRPLDASDARFTPFSGAGAATLAAAEDHGLLLRNGVLTFDLDL